MAALLTGLAGVIVGACVSFVVRRLEERRRLRAEILLEGVMPIHSVVDTMQRRLRNNQAPRAVMKEHAPSFNLPMRIILAKSLAAGARDYRTALRFNEAFGRLHEVQTAMGGTASNADLQVMLAEALTAVGAAADAHHKFLQRRLIGWWRKARLDRLP